jgi:acetyl-CoA acyltransferase
LVDVTASGRAYLLDAVRTPFGRYRGGLAGIRTDDLAALPLAELVARHPDLDPASIDDVVYGNANGAGEDNRNVARMALLLAGLPVSVPGMSINRLCGSGGEALISAARDVRSGDASLVIAGGVEGMSRAPYVLPKPQEVLPRSMQLEQTTVGWRMVNPAFPAEWTAPLGTCAEKVAEELGIERAAQDEWAARSHQRAHAAWEAGLHDDYVMKVDGVLRDECIRPDCTPASLAALKPAFTADGSVTAGNSSPINDGAIATLVGDEDAAQRLGVTPLGRIVAAATAAVEPHRWSTSTAGRLPSGTRSAPLRRGSLSNCVASFAGEGAVSASPAPASGWDRARPSWSRSDRRSAVCRLAGGWTGGPSAPTRASPGADPSEVVPSRPLCAVGRPQYTATRGKWTGAPLPASGQRGRRPAGWGGAGQPPRSARRLRAGR